MAYDFPASPTEGQIFTPPGGPTYRFKSGAWTVEGSYLPDAPLDGVTYGRKNAGWVDITAELLSGKYLPITGGQIDGQLIIAPTVGDALLTLSTTEGGTAAIRGRKGFWNHWIIEAGDDAPQTGANKGSNFLIDRYSDVGAFLGTALKIDRDTGFVTIASGTNGVVMTDTVGISGNSGIWMKSLGVIRWSIYKGGPAETGSGNVGSDLHIFRNNDAGNAINSVLSIARATAAITGSALASAAEYLANSINKFVTTNGLWASAAFVNVTYTASLTLNLGTFINAALTSVTGALTLNNPTGQKLGQSGSIRIFGTASAIAFGTSWWFPPGTKPTVMGGQDVIYYTCVDGTNLFCHYVKGYTNA